MLGRTGRRPGRVALLGEGKGGAKRPEGESASPMASHRDPDQTPEELAAERWVLSQLREIEREVRAPRRLRVRIEADAGSRRQPWGLRAATALAAAAALLAVAVLAAGRPRHPVADAGGGTGEPGLGRSPTDTRPR